jgi:cytochrome c556
MLSLVLTLLLALTQPAAVHAPAEEPLTLAELMRKMTTHTQQMRERVMEGKKLGKLPKEFAGIHTAEPTAQKMKGEHFDAFAEAYLNAVRQLHDRDDPEPKKDVYNRMISTCASCHTQYCPGPLVVIKKLPVQ